MTADTQADITADAARAVVEEVDQLLDAAAEQLLRKNQLRESAGSIAANIREAYGQRRGRGRAKFLHSCPRISGGKLSRLIDKEDQSG
jgi:four helix bundle protein